MFEKIFLKPTPTPVLFYTPPDPKIINLIMGLGVLIFLIVLFGVWLNRSKLNH
jgi:hypothetical protein